MSDYEDHKHVLELLAKDQEADHDNRERARDARLFLNKKDGQWEPKWWNANEGKPRYTFDLCRPVVKQVMGDLRRNEFAIEVTPENGEASKETAEIFDGLVRNIESLSRARHVYDLAGKLMVVSGVDGWRVCQKYVDGDSFDQDLVIEDIPNFLDRCWLDSAASKQTGEDANHGFVMQAYSKAKYASKWPKGEALSVESDNSGNAYFHKPDVIIVGELYYIKEVERELVLMENGKVYEDNDEFKSVADDLLALGVGEVKRRKRKKRVVYSRQFDVGGWLSEPKETVFSFIPLFPVYANFEVYENKILYQGAIEPLMDPQRVFNYAKSREVEEVALAPRAKYWMTPKQAMGHEATLATMNTNADPIQLYNNDPEVPGPPQQNGGAQVNPGLANLSATTPDLVTRISGMFDASMGDNPGLQSGVAIERLQERGDNGSIEYMRAMEIAVGHTARVIVDALPRLYTGKRKARVVKEDGEYDFVDLNDVVIDHATGQEVTLNDLSAGKYGVSCHAGPAFKSRQQRTVSAITEAAQVAPELLQLGGDIFAKSVNAPGMNMLADRIRAMNLQKGIIPFDQMTDEEQQQAQAAAQQPQQPDPNMLIGQAELLKAQTQQQEAQVDAQIRQTELQLKNRQLDQAEMKMVMDQQSKQLRDIAETMKAIREAMGAQAIMSPAATVAFDQQAQRLTQG